MSPDHHPPRIPDQDVHRAVRGAMYVAVYGAASMAIAEPPWDSVTLHVEGAVFGTMTPTVVRQAVFGAMRRAVLEEARRDL